MECVLADNEDYCMSGCDSGWTVYLEHSSISPYASESTGCRENGGFGFIDEDEDLSMVSDASSGPPHLHDEDRASRGPESGAGGCFGNFPIVEEPCCKRGGGKRRRSSQDQTSSLLDDTASSPFFDFSDKKITVDRTQHLEERVLEYSQGYSSTQFEVRLSVRPPYPEQYEFFQSTTASADQMRQKIIK